MFGAFQDHIESSSLAQLFAEFLGIVLTISLLLYWYGTRSFTILKKLNLPGPKPHAFVGNLPDIKKAGDIHKFMLQCVQTYGKCFTVCFGSQVSIAVADPEILKQIMVKEFSNFRNRNQNRTLLHPLHLNVFVKRNEAWKRIRNTLTPAFSAAKLKNSTDLMEAAADTLQNKLKEVADTGKKLSPRSSFKKQYCSAVIAAPTTITTNSATAVTISATATTAAVTITTTTVITITTTTIATVTMEVADLSYLRGDQNIARYSGPAWRATRNTSNYSFSLFSL